MLTVFRGGERLGACLVAAACMLWPSLLGAQQLLDRVVARVNGVALTLTDVRAASALGVIQTPPGAGAESGAIDRLVDRHLVLAEVARFAPPEPAPADVAREVEAMKARAGTGLEAMMVSTGIDETRLGDLARDTLRIEAYLNQRFGTTVQVSDEEVEQYYRIHPDDFTREGTLMPYVEAEPLARQRAGLERRASTVAQWMRDLKGRAEIVRPANSRQ